MWEEIFRTKNNYIRLKNDRWLIEKYNKYRKQQIVCLRISVGHNINSYVASNLSHFVKYSNTLSWSPISTQSRVINSVYLFLINTFYGKRANILKTTSKCRDKKITLQMHKNTTN